MRIDPASRDDVRTVALAMRGRDFAEFSAVSFADTREQLADALAERYGDRHDVMCGFHKGSPACIGGTILARPNVATLLFFATDEFPRIGLPTTRFIKKQLFPRLVDAGVHRIEAVSMEGHVETHAWLRTLGLEPETGPMHGYGRRGEAFIQFAWVQDVRSARP
ncbi:hypothetical protein [Aminobacter sp. BE322]|uniref:hypothetical protein n=1 Tax=unclassified Aminobacter TaxID=2644704 RepID=UPI003D219433